MSTLQRSVYYGGKKTASGGCGKKRNEWYRKNSIIAEREGRGLCGYCGGPKSVRYSCEGKFESCIRECADNCGGRVFLEEAEVKIRQKHREEKERVERERQEKEKEERKRREAEERKRREPEERARRLAEEEERERCKIEEEKRRRFLTFIRIVLSGISGGLLAALVHTAVWSVIPIILIIFCTLVWLFVRAVSDEDDTYNWLCAIVVGGPVGLIIGAILFSFLTYGDDSVSLGSTIFCGVCIGALIGPYIYKKVRDG